MGLESRVRRKVEAKDSSAVILGGRCAAGFVDC